MHGEKKPHPKALYLEERKGVEHQHNIPELKKFLEEYWEVIDEIYYSLQKRSGVKKPRHIPHKIKFIKSFEFGTLAGSSPYDRASVQFNKRYRHEETRKDWRTNVSTLLHYWIHEAVHGTSNIKIRLRKSKLGVHVESGLSSQALWLDHSTKDKFNHEELGDQLNEAITEHIANTILSELSRRGVFKRGDEQIREEAAYKSFGESFTQIVEVLAKHFEVTEEIIWQSFVRQYFSGEIPLDKFYGMLVQLSEEKDLKPIRQKVLSLLNMNNESNPLRVGKEEPGIQEKKDGEARKALEWSKRGLKLDQ